MRTSRYLLATLKETPADAEVISHQLMLRAGLIRRLSAGLYTWLPTGLRVMRKVENIVREEMNRAGAQEILMPSVQPAELWEESGRWAHFGPELLRIKDRHDRDFCYGPTHEEVITDLIRREIRSYKQLPASFYQIQTKFRDEIRPRFGVMRAREFLMKDAYSFDPDQAGLNASYEAMRKAYCAIFDRLGLRYRVVEADSGSIGGSRSEEFHVLADSGEDDIAYSTDSQSQYAANVEAVPCLPPAIERPQSQSPSLAVMSTPDQRTITDVTNFLNISPQQCLKTLLVKGSNSPLVAIVLRGDHTLNEIKAAKLPQIAEPLTFATPEEVKTVVGCEVGSIGPVGLNVPILADHATLVMADFVCGANQTDQHLVGVNWGRDLPEPETVDLRNAEAGDPSPDGKGMLNIDRGIEVGHIFQLGDKYSKAMNATVQDEDSHALTLNMGCYGIGVSRIVAAAIEQNHDERGIIWTQSIAPFDLVLLPMNMHKSERVQAIVEEWYLKLQAVGIDVLLDDRRERPGVMFADMELIGIPHRLVIGERGLDAGYLEYKSRRSPEAQNIPLDEVIDFLLEKIHV